MSLLTNALKQFQRNLRQNLQAMASTPSALTSLSDRSSTLSHSERQGPNKQDNKLQHAPKAFDVAKNAYKQLCTVKPLDIEVSSSDQVKTVSGILHLPQSYHWEHSDGGGTGGAGGKTAAILLSGASGGLVGPSSIYLSIADKVASLNHGIPVLRLDYRYPARNKYCVPDVVAAMNYLQAGYAISRFVLVGWSYGGAPVFTVGGRDDRVVGCATVASQTAETDGIRSVARKGVPILLLHGTGDRTLSPSCSESLYQRYRNAARGGQREIKLFEDDDHALTRNSLQAEELLCEFIMRQAGGYIGQSEKEGLVQKPLLEQTERIEKMKEGGDLRGESIE